MMGWRIPWHERDKQDKAVYRVVGGWSSRRTSGLHNRAHVRSVKNSAKLLPNERDNDAVPHYQLQQNRYPFFLLRLRIGPYDAKCGNTHRSHHYSKCPLWALRPPSPEWLVECVPRPLSIPESSEFADRQSWLRRSCFFLPNEGEQLIHFSFSHRFWLRCFR